MFLLPIVLSNPLHPLIRCYIGAATLRPSVSARVLIMSQQKNAAIIANSGVHSLCNGLSHLTRRQRMAEINA
jgi:hypothetical protein